MAQVALVVGLGAGLVGNASVDAQTRQSKPNIIFIMADDLGYGDLGSYGQKTIQTPRLDQLAAEGLRFTQFYAGSTVCAPSRCVLMTGMHTGKCFIRGNGKDNLRPEDVTVAEVLKEAGYRTALIGKWGLGHEGSTGVPTRQGFDYFFGYLDQHHAHNYYPSFLVRNEQRVKLPNQVSREGQYGQGVAIEKRVYSHDLIADEAVQFIERNKDGPFFLYLALTIPHANNEAGREGMEVPDLGQYADRDWPEPQKGHAAMITLMDRDIGRLVDKLRELKIEENTLILFTSDNGPHREGGNDPEFQNSSGPLKGIKRSLHDGGIRVPLIAHWPKRIKPGQTTDWIGSFSDVLPTLADLAHVASAVPDEVDGVTFLPTLMGEGEQKDHEYLFWAFYEAGGARALRAGDWKAVQQPYQTAVRLYNLADDIGETKNLADDNPALVARLTGLMDSAYEPSSRWQYPKSRKQPERRSKQAGSR